MATTTKKTLQESLIEIQRDLKCPKDKYNAFGKYNYRSAEGILEHVKPLLHERGILMTINDNIIEVGGRNYIQAVIALARNGETFATQAVACEQAERKGMDSAQISGATASYARKYALSAMFLLDDGVDADSRDNRAQNGNNREPAPPPAPPTQTPRQKQAEKPEFITDAQMRLFWVKIKEKSIPDKLVKQFLAAAFHIQHTAHIPKRDFQAALDWIEEYIPPAGPDEGDQIAADLPF